MNLLFVCVHNAGRSQMAEAFARQGVQERRLAVEVASAGTLGGGHMNPVVVEAMLEIGVSMQGQTPKVLTQGMADQADRIISMGCGVDVTACPARFLVTEDWGLDDPAGQSIEKVREIRDQIQQRVRSLLDQVQAATSQG